METRILLNITDTHIELPPLLVRYPVNAGMITHLLKPKSFEAIIARTRVRISPRIEEDAIKINDEVIIITRRSGVVRPENVDGILKIDSANHVYWISHKLIEQFNDLKTSQGLKSIADDIKSSWEGQFYFKAEELSELGDVIKTGLRPPQIGGLYAVGAHWSLSQLPATVVMPTGTGKTETMLAVMIAFRPRHILVVVPSKVLRDQTALKFYTLGLLRKLGNIAVEIKNPIVGVMFKRPRSEADLEMLNSCNVVITTMNAIAGESVQEFGNSIAERVDILIVDEAHHIPAKTWSVFKQHFQNKRVLQFTATPYRRDAKLVEGKVIFNYPLASAQKDGYFKSISFEPVNVDDEDSDREIGASAIKKLTSDIEAGYDHLIMARCDNIERAILIHHIYNELGPQYQPLLIHSEEGNVVQNLAKLRSRESRIVVCVDMLGEGFDFPQLKIAAIHDTHKSIAILLQFTGRFTRSAGDHLGNATVIANIANPDVSAALDRLYSEDADWNILLSEISSEASRRHAALIDFLSESVRLDPDDEADELEVSPQLLRPLLSTVLFKASNFTPESFFNGLTDTTFVHRVWLHRESNTLYFVTRTEPKLQWTRSKDLRDRQWDLYVVHFDPEQNLLFISSSNKDSTHENLALAVGAESVIKGDNIFRCLVGINRLIFQNIGVRKLGRRNLSFALYTGADVKQALALTETTGSVKSNLSGTGWENGEPLTIGCSLKGRIWSRDGVTIPEFVEWSESVGRKILDDTLNTDDILANVLIPEETEALPHLPIINLDWPIEILRQSEDRVIFKKASGDEIPIMLFDLAISSVNYEDNTFIFRIFNEENANWGIFRFAFHDIRGFVIEQVSADVIDVTIGRLSLTLAEYFTNYPPIIRFVDLSELDGNLLIKPNEQRDLIFPEDQLQVWNWNEVDISKESLWKNGVERTNSIQAFAISQVQTEGFEVIFDDDAPGEAADIVCIREDENEITLKLIHCKFSGGDDPGERVKDVVEVASQAIRSSKWKWKFKDLLKHIAGRERRLSNGNRTTRFIQGSSTDLNKFHRLIKLKKLIVEIIIVQPGFSVSHNSPDQLSVLAAAYSYLEETIGVRLRVIGSE